MKMSKYRFTVTDYRKITRSMLYFFVFMLPSMFITFFILKPYKEVDYLIAAFIIAAVVLVVYFGVVKYALIYDSEFSLDDNGIYERNIKKNKEFSFTWDDIESIKFSNTKHVDNMNEYMTIKFISSKHTISVTRQSNDYEQQKLYDSFKEELLKMLSKSGLAEKIEINESV